MSRIESTPGELAAVHDHEMAEAAANHGLGRPLERPVGRCEGQVGGKVGAHLLAVRVLAGRDRLEHVALGEDSGAGLLGVDHHGRAHVALRHEAGGSSQRMTGIDREHDPRHPVLNLHFRTSYLLVTIGSSYRTLHPIAPSLRNQGVVRESTVSRRRRAVRGGGGRWSSANSRPRTCPGFRGAERSPPPARQLQRAFAENGARRFRRSSSACAWSARPTCCGRSDAGGPVAGAVGYRQAAQFAKAFRRHHGRPAVGRPQLARSDPAPSRPA